MWSCRFLQWPHHGAKNSTSHIQVITNNVQIFKVTVCRIQSLQPGSVLAALCAGATAFYSSGDGVVDLTPSNFDREVVNSDALWIVEFYAPWCGHCQSLTPEWKKAAKALQGVVKGFPTIKIFGLNKNKPEDYQGGRTADAIVNSLIVRPIPHNQLKQVIHVKNFTING
ncbi:PDIA6 [Mytilus edulis]|uniref:PDIA6 n=1 Tax=Mytilus edulis TaxID=6550 RepID=A0A8S3Q0E7_MYTED|nr:PDIA6 [Mytilus edulis]